MGVSALVTPANMLLRNAKAVLCPTEGGGTTDDVDLNRPAGPVALAVNTDGLYTRSVMKNNYNQVIYLIEDTGLGLGAATPNMDAVNIDAAKDGGGKTEENGVDLY